MHDRTRTHTPKHVVHEEVSVGYKTQRDGDARRIDGIDGWRVDGYEGRLASFEGEAAGSQMRMGVASVADREAGVLCVVHHNTFSSARGSIRQYCSR